jgi:hypothetical protein
MLKEKHEKTGSIRRVAQECGFSAASFYNYTESDTEPDLATWQSIAKGLGTTVEFLRGTTDSSAPGKVASAIPQSPTRAKIEELLDMESDDELEEYLFLIMERKRKAKIKGGN